jgi:hypothetical protein
MLNVVEKELKKKKIKIVDIFPHQLNDIEKKNVEERQTWLTKKFNSFELLRRYELCDKIEFRICSGIMKKKGVI